MNAINVKLPFFIRVLRRRDGWWAELLLVLFLLLGKCFSLFVNNLLGEVNKEQPFRLFIWWVTQQGKYKVCPLWRCCSRHKAQTVHPTRKVSFSHLFVESRLLLQLTPVERVEKKAWEVLVSHLLYRKTSAVLNSPCCIDGAPLLFQLLCIFSSSCWNTRILFTPDVGLLQRNMWRGKLETRVSHCTPL